MVENQKSRSTNGVLTVIVVLLSLAATCSMTYLARHFEMDDALIYYRYLENVVTGNGLVYNIGVKFNGLTSPLYAYLSIPVAFLFKNIPLNQIILSGLFLFLSGIALIYAFRNEISEIVLLILPLLLVTQVYFYYTFGMESTLFLLLIILEIYFYKINHIGALSITSALLLLTRGESLFLLLILAVAYFIKKRSFPSWKYFVIPFMILAAHYLFNYYYYGELMPATLSAKIGQGKSGLWGAPPLFLHNKKDYLQQFYGMNIALIGTMTSLTIIGVIRSIKNSLGIICLAYFILYNSFYLILNIPNYHWYYLYDILYLIILVGYGLDWVRAVIVKMEFINSKVVANAAVVALLLTMVILQASWTIQSHKKLAGLEHYKEAGLWLKANTSPEAKVAAVEIGTIGWYSKRYIIDILGLVNPYNAELISKKDFYGWLKYYTPDFIIAHDPFWSHEVSIKDLVDSKKYKQINRIENVCIYKKSSE